MNDDSRKYLWAEAKKHLDHVDQAYLDLSLSHRVNVHFVRQMVIAPLRIRYENGERTPELYDAMIALE